MKMTEESRGLTKTIDSPKTAVAFAADVVASIHQLWDRTPLDEAEVTVEITLVPPEEQSDDC